MKKTFLLVLPVLLLVGCGDTPSPADGPKGKYDSFSSCLTESDAVFYGTTWCVHCKKQKTLFGNSIRLINFVDCDKKSATCRKEKITGYPTWKFADGSTLSGTQSLETLSEKTSCEIPSDKKEGE